MVLEAPQVQVQIATPEKWCRECFTRKSVDDFYRDRAHKDGRCNTCKPCWKIRNSTPEKLKAQRFRSDRHYYLNKDKKRAQHLRLTYGITPEEHTALFKAQNYCCAICGTDKSKANWATDHCHSSGKVRGILCHSCNTLLGHAKDRVKTLQAAIKYLTT